MTGIRRLNLVVAEHTADGELEVLYLGRDRGKALEVLDEACAAGTAYKVQYARTPRGRTKKPSMMAARAEEHEREKAEWAAAAAADEGGEVKRKKKTARKKAGGEE